MTRPSSHVKYCDELQYSFKPLEKIFMEYPLENHVQVHIARKYFHLWLNIYENH